MTTERYITNRYPGPCFYCAKRVQRGQGNAWLDKSLGKWAVAHVVCLGKAHEAGRAPEHKRTGGVCPVTTDAGETRGNRAWTLRRIRAAIQKLTVDAADRDLDHAFGEIQQALEDLHGGAKVEAPAREPAREPGEDDGDTALVMRMDATGAYEAAPF